MKINYAITNDREIIFITQIQFKTKIDVGSTPWLTLLTSNIEISLSDHRSSN